MAKRIDYKRGTAVSYSNLGHISIVLGKHNEALNYYEKSLKIFEQLGDKQQIATSYTDIATAYYYLCDYLKNIEYNNKALNLYDSILFNGANLSYTYTSLGSAYEKIDNYEKAMTYFFKSLSVLEAFNKTEYFASNYNNIATVYELFDNLDEALKFYHKA